MATPTDNLFMPLANKRSFEEVSDRIKSLIINGHLKPGDRLPSELDLASRFNVSRQTIREALRILELSGLVAVQRGGRGGPVVQDAIGEKIRDLFNDALRMEKVTLHELVVARVGLERLVLSILIETGGTEHFRPLEENVAEATRLLAAGQMATVVNLEFHRLLAKACNNYVLEVMVESVLVLLKGVLDRVGPDFETSREAVRYHRNILKALAGKRLEEANRLMEEHVRSSHLMQ